MRCFSGVPPREMWGDVEHGQSRNVPAVLGAFSSSVMSQRRAKTYRTEIFEAMSNGPSKPIFDVEIPMSKVLGEEMKEDCRSCKVIGVPSFSPSILNPATDNFPPRNRRTHRCRSVYLHVWPLPTSPTRRSHHEGQHTLGDWRPEIRDLRHNCQFGWDGCLQSDHVTTCLML